MRNFKTLAAVVLVIFAGSCYNDKRDRLYPDVKPPVTTCDTTTVTFAHDIMPILQASCNISGGCHDAAGFATSGFNFTTHAGIYNAAINGLIVSDINWEPGHNPMPKNLPKLPQCDIDKITRWVNQGAQDN